eukprot:TRINITY_DN12457_c0_g1_i1.p1 TRINITY_DN12457_c0_g1~~TRINITY_DN12457_c0_g1_i1.p1  ORF type:complete len:263 (-),score=53.66 TRINITY_DN12457_c0_g1_i1:247-1035(-)
MNSSTKQCTEQVKSESICPKRCNLKKRQLQWKEKLTKECFLRVQEQRHHLLWKSRSSKSTGMDSKESMVSAFGQIVSDQMEKMKNLSQTNTQGSSVSNDNDILWNYERSDGNIELDDEEYADLLIKMEQVLYEDIEAEHRERDAALLEDYEEACALEDEYLVAAFEHMRIKDQDNAILCPLCWDGYLNQQKCLISCGNCKVLLDIQNEQIDLQFLQRRLSEVLEEHHEKGCNSKPNFSLECKFDISALYMTCKLCEAFELVL